MATWKKVIVSGSDISQLNNDAGYLTSVTAMPAFVTASFDGTNIIADGSNGVLNFASSSDQGLTISADAGSDTLTFGLASIPNTSLANSTISGISLGSDLNDLTVDDATLTLDSGTTYNGGTAKTISVKDGGIDTDAIADSLGTIGVNSFTGSFSGSFTGDVDIDLADLTDGNGIVDFTYDGNSPATVAVQADSTTGGDTVPVSVGANGVGLNLTTIDGTGIGTSGAGELTIDLTEITVSNGLDTPDATTLNLDLTEVIATDGVNRVLTSDGDGTLTAEPNFIFTGTDLTVTGNQTITGDLTVQGTASFQEQENLRIADRFALFASGSTTVGDGGIVVQQTVADTGELFGYDSSTERWAVTSSFDASTSAFTPDAFMAVAFAGTGDDPTAIDSKYQAKGNIFVADNQDIFIYS